MSAHGESGPKRKWVTRAQTVAGDPLRHWPAGQLSMPLFATPATSGVLGCLVPSLGRANETALRHKRRNS